MNMLSENFEFRVRFNEADPLGIVWHGNYLKYFEDGREAFGARHGLTYLDIFNYGFVVPLVSIHCDFKQPMEYGDRGIVETTYIDSPAAKIQFTYRLYAPETGNLIATGNSVQVFLDRHNKLLQLTNPGFFEEWRRKQNLI